MHHKVQVINDIRGFSYYLLCRGNPFRGTQRVVWQGFSAYDAFLALYKVQDARK